MLTLVAVGTEPLFKHVSGDMGIMGVQWPFVGWKLSDSGTFGTRRVDAVSLQETHLGAVPPFHVRGLVRLCVYARLPGLAAAFEELTTCLSSCFFLPT